MTKTRRSTPVRSALRVDSVLLSKVRNGLQAVESSHRDYFEEGIRTAFADSLNIDDGLRAGNEQANRWDYLLGHTRSRALIAVEPHSAKTDEISTIVRKRMAAIDQLSTHLRDGAVIRKWLWVASGNVQFANTEKAHFRLASSGIEFVGKRVMAKHLPDESV